jgi:hypothetical protein
MKKKILKPKINETFLASIIVFVVVIAFVIWRIEASDTFVCPNDYKTPREYVIGSADYISNEMKQNPGISIDEILSNREKLLERNHCESSKWMMFDEGN